MIRVMSGVLWATVTGLGVLMLARGVWALQQPWRSTGEKLFGLAFFVALTAFAGYKLLTVLATTASRLRSRPVENMVHGLVSLVFVIGGVFVYFRGHESASGLFITVGGILFFGVGAIVLFTRVRRRYGD